MSSIRGIFNPSIFLYRHSTRRIALGCRSR